MPRTIKTFNKYIFVMLNFPRSVKSKITSLVNALFRATACSALTFFLCRTSSMLSDSLGSIPSRSRNSSFSISLSFTLISKLFTWLVRSSMFLKGKRVKWRTNQKGSEYTVKSSLHRIVCFLTSRTHVAVHQFGNRLEMTSKYDKSKGTGKRGIDVIVREGGGGRGLGGY